MTYREWGDLWRARAEKLPPPQDGLAWLWGLFSLWRWALVLGAVVVVLFALLLLRR
jgi:hypothetical protein